MRIPRKSLIVALVLAFVLPSLAFGHAVVLPKASTVGTYERYVLRVPNEGSTPTTRVEMRVPAGVRVTAFAEVAGWSLEIQSDSSGRVIGAVWTGSLGPKRFVEFPFVGVNPKETGALTWAVYQTYGGNDRVEWTGPEGSESPASVTTIGPKLTEVAPSAGAGGGSPAWVAWSALIVAVLGLGSSLLRSTRA